MKSPLKSVPKWLLVPPVVALLLVLGPLSMQGAEASTPAAEPRIAAEPAPAAAERTARPAPAVPRTPALWQVGSALAAVLLLGAGGVVALRRLRGGAVPVRGAAPLITLRQTLRLSARQAVHAIEFDDRILLLGEHERGLTLLDGGRAIARDDEHAITARHGEGDDDDGAVPKDLVIPRPPQQPARQRHVTGTRTTTAAPRLEDFRRLLQKAGRS